MSNWDPLIYSPHLGTRPSVLSLGRIRHDISTILKDLPPGISIATDESDFTIVHALIIGPSGTPYEKGFFYFIIRFPYDYPIHPPLVKFMTTGGGYVRFNPNFYSNGKVCLSILGTWEGPPWSPAQSLSSLLVSIQSILNEKPYHNEPGFEEEKHPGDAKSYNELIRHETLRVAVIGMVDNDYCITIPRSLVQEMERKFCEYYDFYRTFVISYANLDKEPVMTDPFSKSRKTCQYKNILTRLDRCYARINGGYVLQTSEVSSSQNSELGPQAHLM